MAEILLPAHLLCFSFSLLSAPGFEQLAKASRERLDPPGTDRMLDVTQSCLLNKARLVLIIPGISAQSLIKHALASSHVVSHFLSQGEFWYLLTDDSNR